MGFYAVAVGKVCGIYATWELCEAQTKGYSNAKYKKFSTEAAATAFIEEHRIAPTAKRTREVTPPRPSETTPPKITHTSPRTKKSPSGPRTAEE